MKHVITYPGFAEGLSAKGLFTDLRNTYSDKYEFHILPFYEEMPGGDRVVHSISEHRNTVQEYMDSLDGEITILGKCGGSRVVVDLDDEHLARVDAMALFNPPWAVSRSRLEARFEGWEGSRRPDGSWVIPRDSDRGYVITPEYMKDASSMSMMDRYRRIARSATKFFIVRGMKDEVIPNIRVDRIEGAVPIDIVDGNHHLTGPARALVISALAKYAVL